MTIICIIIFLCLSIWQYRVLTKNQHIIKSPIRDGELMICSGEEMFMIVLFATAFIGLSPVLSLRLAFLELLIVFAILRSKNRPIISLPIIVFIMFLAWLAIGLFYTPNVMFGFRMILKYIYPFLVFLLASCVVRDPVVFLQSGLMARKVATIGIVILFIPIISRFFGMILWYSAAYITGIISLIVFSFAMAEFSNEKKKNFIWGLVLCVFCLLATFRTDIFGTCVAIATYFLIKYRIKAVPFILAIGVAGLLMMFYIPSVKEKMFIDPDKASIEEYARLDIDQDNVQTNYRAFMWEDATDMFYDGHELMGSGTGRVQTWFYTEATDNRQGGQLHNDFLVIKCDNGDIGFWLFIASYIAILLHCMHLYKRSPSNIVRMAAIIAGASLMGVCVTMYSDNTLSYSMVTLSFPWGFYGMTLGLNKAFRNEQRC